MRTIGAIVAGLVLLAPAGVARADDRDKARAVVEEAIKAHGGADALEKMQTRSRAGRGSVRAGGADVPFTTEETVRLPDRCRVDLEVNRNRIVIVVDGEKGWMRAGGAAQEMTRQALAERREEVYVWWLMTLTPLRKDDFELAPLPDAKVNGQDAAVVKVTRRGYPDARLFFDRKTGLLVKIARRTTEAGTAVTKEYFYGEFKEFDGAKLPTRETVTLFGSKLSEATFESYKPLARVEDRTFARP